MPEINYGSPVASGEIQVISSASLPNAGTGQTLVNASSGVTNPVSDGATVHTVTSGKTFYCLGFTLGSTDASTRSMGFSVDSTEVVGLRVESGKSYTASGGGCPIFSASSGSIITLDFLNGAANSAYYTIWGYEE